MDSILSFNALLFPLVGGYYVVTRLERFRYINQRLDNQAILFNSIIVGIFLLLGCIVLNKVATYFLPGVISDIRNSLPVKRSYFGTCVSSFLLAYVGTLLFNALRDEKKEVNAAIKKIGNELERLFLLSVNHNQLLLLTLKNDKIYIGWVQRLPRPSKTSYVEIIRH